MKQTLSRIANKLFIPLIILTGISVVFEKELVTFPFIRYLRICLFILIILMVIGHIIEFFERK